MKQFDEILAKASAAIEPGFFKLPIYGGPPVYRERVYCYELYHQMRCIWPGRTETDFVLNGEVDKQAHAALKALGVKGQKPDLLVHVPGQGNGKNFAIIEVKHIEGAMDDPEKDLETLALFKSNVGYARAIYLIYGDEAGDKILEKALQVAAKIKDWPTRGIELWLHQGAGQAAHCAKTIP